MFSYGLLASLALAAPAAPTAQGEKCAAGWQDASGEARSTPIVIEFASGEPLDKAALPEGASGVACRRASVIPLPEAIRVLTELGVSLGLVEEAGRSLWIWSQDGRLRTNIDNGELSPAEAAAVSRWSAAAQPRFDERCARR